MNHSHKIKTALSLLAMFVVTRAVLIFVGVTSISHLPITLGTEYKRLNTTYLLDMWYRWDAGFYTSIATHGYQWFNTQEPKADIAFLPLYPLTIRSMNFVSGCSEATCTVITGLIVSNAALLGSVYLLYNLIIEHTKDKIAYRAVWLLLLTPNSIFLSGIYTEALFLFLSLLVFWALKKEKFFVAVFAASFACITRTVGLSLCLPLLVTAWKQPMRQRKIRLVSAHIPLLVFGGYLAFTGFMTNDWLAYFHANAQIWERPLIHAPWELITIYFSGESVSLWGWKLSWIDLIFTITYVFLAFTVWIKYHDLGFFGFALFATLIPIASGTLVAMPRYGAVIFPYYMVIAEWADRKWQQFIVFALSILLMILFTTRFVTWHWIA